MASVEKIEDLPAAEADRPSKGSIVATEDSPSSDEDARSEKQDGVEQLEAITQAWSKRALYITFVLLVIFQYLIFLFVLFYTLR